MLTAHETVAPSASPPACLARTSGIAEVQPIPLGEAGRILTPFHNLVAAGLVLLPIPVGLAGLLGGVGLAIHLSGRSEALGFACAGLGALVAGLSLVVLLGYQQYLASRYRWRVAQRVFATRTNPLVNVNDPEAEFVDIVPRANWRTNMLEQATDVGLWKIDQSRREFLFEGDSKRYRIPFSAVVSCDVDEMKLDADDWGTDLAFATLLTVDTRNGAREIPLCGKHLSFGWRRLRQRLAQAEVFFGRIQEALES
ncbi:MAG: hypothetical protein ACT4QC_16635 [Planctomycetaceae bacterium]